MPLHPLGGEPTALRLAAGAAGRAAAMCWAQTRELEIGLDERVAGVHLNEIGAGLRAARRLARDATPGNRLE